MWKHFCLLFSYSYSTTIYEHIGPMANQDTKQVHTRAVPAERLILIGGSIRQINEFLRSANYPIEDNRLVKVVHFHDIMRTYGLDRSTTMWAYLGGINGTSPGAAIVEMESRFGASVPFELALKKLQTAYCYGTIPPSASET